MGIIHLALAFLKAFFAGRTALAAENLALRHQLAVVQRSLKRPKLRKRDRESGHLQASRGMLSAPAA